MVVVSSLILIGLLTPLFKVKYKNDNKNVNRVKEETSGEDIIKQSRNIGEKFVDLCVKRIIGDNGYLLNNVILPLKEDGETEIDGILISNKGIFCIEIKNRVGHIIGTDELNKWLQIYDDPSKVNKSHDNPIKQNKYHCSVLNAFF